MVFSLLLSLFRGLVEADAFERIVDGVRFLGGAVAFDEVVHQGAHRGGEGRCHGAGCALFAAIAAPFFGFLFFVAAIVGEVVDGHYVEDEVPYSVDGELAAVFGCEVFGFLNSEGFYDVDLCLDGFFLGAQGAQEF